MIGVAWFEQTEADVPQDDSWFSANERDRFRSMRFAKRRGDWRLGRWTAKRALGAYFGLPPTAGCLAKIEVVPGPTGAPGASLDGERAAATISLTHREGKAACAISRSEVQLGCDLEIIEPHSSEFFEDYFAIEEQLHISGAPVTDRSRLLALFWSAKESALKALQEGLRLDTRSVVVCSIGKSVSRGQWTPLEVRCADRRFLYGWWQHTDHVVRTLVCYPRPAWPISLIPPAYSSISSYRCA